MRNSYQWLNAVLFTAVKYPVIKFKALFIRLSFLACREDTGPVDGSTEAFESHLRKERCLPHNDGKNLWLHVKDKVCRALWYVLLSSDFYDFRLCTYRVRRHPSRLVYSIDFAVNNLVCCLFGFVHSIILLIILYCKDVWRYCHVSICYFILFHYYSLY